MMSLINNYIIQLLLFLILADCSVIYLDCGESEQLCPSSMTEYITLSCAVSSGYLQWAVINQVMDFTHGDTVMKERGPFLAKYKSGSSYQGVESTLTFNSSLVSVGTIIKCRDNVNGGEKRCQTRIYESLIAPSNLSYNDHYLSWSSPNTSIDYYSIVIVGMTTNNTYTTNSTILNIPTTLSDGLYTAYVRGVACQGQVIGDEASLVFELKAFVTISPSPSSVFVSIMMSTTRAYSQIVSFIDTSLTIVSSDPTVSSSHGTGTVRIDVPNNTISTTISMNTVITTLSNGQSSISQPSSPTTDDKALTWSIQIVSSTIGAFTMAICLGIFVCFYRLIFKKCKPHVSPLPAPPPPPPSLPPPSSHHSTSSVTYVTPPVDLPHKEDIRVVVNPCYQNEFALSYESDYQMPECMTTLDSNVSSRIEHV